MSLILKLFENTVKGQSSHYDLPWRHRERVGV